MNSFISPAIADVMLWLMYIILAAAIGVTAYSVWHGLRNRRKGSDVVNGVPAGRIGWLVAVGFVLIMVVTFALGSTKPILTNGTWLTDGFWLRAADMFIYTSIILIIGLVILAVGAGLSIAKIEPWADYVLIAGAAVVIIRGFVRNHEKDE